MKVLMLNGSPHEKGCTYTALAEVAGELNQADIETEIMHVGGGTVHGCMGCGACGKLGKCIYSDDKVNEAVEKMRQSDGLIVGSPVHYASAGWAITSFLTVSSIPEAVLLPISREQPLLLPEGPEQLPPWTS